MGSSKNTQLRAERGSGLLRSELTYWVPVVKALQEIGHSLEQKNT